MRCRILLVALLISCVSFQSKGSDKSHPPAKTARQSKPAVKREIPDHVLYDFYFRRLALIKEKADARINKGQSAIALRSQIMQELSIDEGSELIIENIAIRCMQEARDLDKRAQEVIEHSRAMYPNGRVDKAQMAPRPPKELLALNDQRKAIFLRAQSDLRQLLGQSTFDQVDLRIKKHTKSKIGVNSR